MHIPYYSKQGPKLAELDRVTFKFGDLHKICTRNKIVNMTCIEIHTEQDCNCDIRRIFTRNKIVN